MNREGSALDSGVNRVGRIVVLTGAGISAESGLATFRGAGGLWEGRRVEEVATPEAFARNPRLVHRFYNERRRRLLEVEPNEGHRALARLEADYRGEVLVITQNVDDLHERGGTRRLLHMHGELLKARCTLCREVCECRQDLGPESVCDQCGGVGSLRPHITWFGETPFFLDAIYQHLRSAGLLISVGTSGQVHPAAGFVEVARQAGARTVEVNPEQSGMGEQFHDTRRGTAGEVLPGLVQAILRGEA